jgi:hypothetical protein
MRIYLPMKQLRRRNTRQPPFLSRLEFVVEIVICLEPIRNQDMTKVEVWLNLLLLKLFEHKSHVISCELHIQ